MSEQKKIQCYHCGNKTLMNLISEQKVNWDEGEGYYGYYKYQIYNCPICNKPTVLQLYWDVSQVAEEPEGQLVDVIDEEVIFPTISFKDKYIPDQIKKAYESALKTRYIDSSVCLMALRRTLEIICKEKGAIGDNLWKKIEDLSNKGVLPPELKHASLITKKYGNIGAHENIDIASTELDRIIDFVKYIIEYLYILPGKIEEIQDKLK